jgi:hypothetical protein
LLKWPNDLTKQKDKFNSLNFFAFNLRFDLIFQMNKFCRDTETVFAHNPYRPNKHNAMCEQKSTWSVIIANPDFIGVTPMDAEYPPETTFKILRPQEERFVFVLDVSGSMADANRIGRLIQSSNRWVKYEVRDGSQVGVTSFR